MAGMLQIITYLLAVYLVVKGIEVLMIALASSRQDRRHNHIEPEIERRNGLERRTGT